ncbi:MAG: PspC domain-containing protein [Bacteroidales bacterium]|nr:PspC domain-containing protein [Bacteroidales bacterium]
MLKKLYRSRTDRKIAGVCGGFAECFGIDPSIVRLGLVVISVVSLGIVGILLYLLAIIIVPEQPM